jgi:hypothetical protein
MSGATAAHASYNGSGTQGLAVTNKIDDTGDIISAIWGKDDTTKQLLHGASLIEIPASGGGTSPGNIYTFTLNSDMDAIGDLYLIATLGFSANVQVLQERGFTLLINRVEFHCGTQIWQTLEHDDLVALNSTELSESAFEKYILSAQGYFSDSSINRTASNFLLGNATTRVISFKIPLLTRTVSPTLNNFSNINESGFLTAAAPNQTIKIRVFTNSLADMMAENIITTASSTTSTLDLRLYGNHLVMCNEEREKIRNIPGGIAKRVKITQNASLSSFSAPRNGVITAIIDCDHFSLYASHLIISIRDTDSRMQDNGGMTNVATGDSNKCSLIDADLRLNNTSYCGRLSGAIMSGPLPDSIGLYVNALQYRTVTIVGSIQYVFPLSNYAFSGAGVPLNRFDNIRITVRIAMDTPTASVATELAKISVTCVGESTALYRQGAASISMY